MLGSERRLTPPSSCTDFTFPLSSDDSDDSDAALGTGLSLGSSAPHSSLTVKREPCEQDDGLTEAKAFNGVLLQGDTPHAQKLVVIH